MKGVRKKFQRIFEVKHNFEIVLFSNFQLIVACPSLHEIGFKNARVLLNKLTNKM